MNGTPSPFMIRVIAMDADTPAGRLSYSGSVTGWTGAINAATATVTGPNVATYNGTVTAMDPEGGSDTATFSFGPCEEGGVDL